MRFIVSRRQAERISEWILLSLGIFCWVCALIAGLSISRRYLQHLIQAKNGSRSGLWRGWFKCSEVSNGVFLRGVKNMFEIGNNVGEGDSKLIIANEMPGGLKAQRLWFSLKTCAQRLLSTIRAVAENNKKSYFPRPLQALINNKELANNHGLEKTLLSTKNRNPPKFNWASLQRSWIFGAWRGVSDRRRCLIEEKEAKEGADWDAHWSTIGTESPPPADQSPLAQRSCRKLTGRSVIASIPCLLRIDGPALGIETLNLG